MLTFDEYDLEKTAEVLLKINKSVEENGYDKESLIGFMRSMAYQYLEKSNNMSTFGFMLSAYDTISGNRVVRASITSSMVDIYLQEVEKKKKN